MGAIGGFRYVDIGYFVIDIVKKQTAYQRNKNPDPRCNSQEDLDSSFFDKDAACNVSCGNEQHYENKHHIGVPWIVIPVVDV